LTRAAAESQDLQVSNFVDMFNDSFDRLMKTGIRRPFLDSFYNHFIGSGPAVAEKFEDTNMGHQKQMLAESLTEMREFFLKPEDNPYLVTLARIHGVRGREISSELYDVWLDSLVAAVEEHDPEFVPYVALAWRVVMAPGIAFMRFFYDR
jgi:hemoglobin-like flavoprotein